MNLDSYKITRVLKQLKNRIQRDEVPALGAQLTYYLILSFFPFLIFLITILSHTTFSSEYFMMRLASILPEASFNIISDVIDEVVNNGTTSLLSFSIIGALWSASNGVAAIIKGLNKAYDQSEHRSFIKLRGCSIIITITFSLGVVLAFILLVFGELLGNYIFNILGLFHYFKIFWNTVRLIFPIILLIIVFILFYKIAPDKKLSLREVFPGAIFSTGSWILISLLFSYYVNNFGNYTRIYGSIGGIIILLIWLYISSIIILLGGELNAALSYIKNT